MIGELVEKRAEALAFCADAMARADWLMAELWAADAWLLDARIRQLQASER